MTFYIGYPLKWPDGTIFGTICVLDSRRNKRAVLFREGLQEFARVIEADLELFTEINRRIALKCGLQALSEGRKGRFFDGVSFKTSSSQITGIRMTERP